MNAPFTALRTALASRSPRERRLILIAASVISLALFIALWEWTLSEQRRLQHQVPEAQAQLVRMQDDAAELLRLSRLPAATALDADTLAQTVRATAQARGLSAKVDGLGQGVQVEARGTFPNLVDWLATLQAEQRLRATRVDMNQQADGQVLLTATLTP